MAQLVAHLLCKQGVRGSSPLGSTLSRSVLQRAGSLWCPASYDGALVRMFPLRAHVHTRRCWWNHEIAAWVCAPGEADIPPQVSSAEVRVVTETEVTAALVGEVSYLP